jgi:hypothetical protein
MLDMATKIVFKVKTLGFPKGVIYQMYVWLDGGVENAGEYITNHADEIKESLKTTMYVHSIEHCYTTYTNNKPVNENYGDIILDKEIELGDKKVKTKTEIKPITDITKVDLLNINTIDLTKLRGKIGEELFKRTHNLSDDVYQFYLNNMKTISVEEAKKICEEHGGVDMFLLKKREIRKKVQEKISTT